MIKARISLVESVERVLSSGVSSLIHSNTNLTRFEVTFASGEGIIFHFSFYANSTLLMFTMYYIEEALHTKMTRLLSRRTATFNMKLLKK